MTLDQLRDETDYIISRNPSTVSLFISGALAQEEVRFSHESASVPTNKTTPVGLGTSFSLYLVARWDSIVTENSVLIENGKGWKVGPVDELKYEEECYRKRAPLTSVALGASNQINAAKIGSVAGVINNSNRTITFTLPVGTDVTALTPSITHNGKMIAPTGAQDFSTPQVYQVTAENLSPQNYTVMVVLA